MQCLFTKKVTLAQHANEFLVFRVRLTNRHANLTLRNNEERVTASALSHNVITLLIEGLFQHIGNLDQRVFGQFFEDRHAETITLKHLKT